VPEDLFGKAQQDLLALRRWQTRPDTLAERGARGGDRTIDVLGIAGCHARQELAGRGIDAVESGA